MKTDFINSFVKKVRNGEMSFSIQNDSSFISYIGAEQLGSVFYYACNGYGSNPMLNANSKFELAAVLERGTNRIWLFDPFCFDFVVFPEHLPVGVHPASVKRADIEKTLYDTYNKRLKNAKAVEFDYEHEYCSFERELKKEARRRALGLVPMKNSWIYPISNEHVLRVLSGSISEERLVDCILESESNRIVRLFSIEKAIEEFAKNAAKEYEIDMAKSLVASGAKNVEVEFEKGGINVTTKMPASKIIENLIEQHEFNWWDFETDKEGQRVLKELGAAGSGGTIHVNYNDIVDIRYRGKDIYSMPF